MIRFGYLALALLVGSCTTHEDKPASSQYPLSKEELGSKSSSLSAGELDYRRYCIGCHGDDGRGNGGITGADLTARDGPLFSKSDDQLLVSVRDGKTGKYASMPAHKPVLSEARIRAVLAFARQRFAGSASP